MKPPPRRDGAARREALLDAALRTYAERGVLAAGIEDIRRAAEASPSSVYHLFPDGLPGLTIALLTRTFERLFRHLAERVLPTTTAEAAVRALVDAHLEWIFANRAEAKVMYQAMTLELGAEHAGALAASKSQLLAPVVAHLTPFMRAGALPRWAPPVLDVVLLGAAHEACRRLLAGAPLDTDWLRRTLPLVAWRSVARKP